MFQYVHHVHYVVHDRDEMVVFMEQAFGLKPAQVNDIHNAKDQEKEALYYIGKTQIQVVQPLDPSTVQGKFLATHGPGLFHIGWGIDDLPKLAQECATKGIKTIRLGKVIPSGQVFQSSHGYKNFNIDPASALGVFFHLCGPREAK